MRPEFLAGSVEDGDEAVGEVGVRRLDPGFERARDRSRHGHPSVGGDGDRIAAGRVRGAEHPRRHQTARRVEFHQGDIALTLHRLLARRGLDVRDHPQRSVRRDRAGPHRLDALRQGGLRRPPGDPARLQPDIDGLRGGAAIALELEQFVPARGPRCLDHIDRVGLLRRREPDGFDVRALDHQGPLVGAGRQGDRPGPRLHRARWPGDVFPPEPGGDAGVGQLAVDV